MDLFEVLVSAVVIAAAIGISDWFFRSTEPKQDYVDRESPWLDRFERPTKKGA